MFRTSLDHLKKDIENLARFTSTPGRGVTRLSFTPEESKAREYIAKQMKEAGLTVRVDGVGTIIGRREGTDPAAAVVMTGSHFDSVKNGGAFDGTAGVVAALEVARVLNGSGIKHVNPIEFVALADEEGVRFGTSMLSSRAMTGKFADEELDLFKDADGVTLREAMVKCGLVPDPAGARYERDRIKAFIELHIEQGPVLDARGTDIGIVENITGLCEYRATVRGRAGHAGTTPMEARADVMPAAARAIIAADTAAIKAGSGTAATVGRIELLPGAANVIPDYVEFSLDIRFTDESKLELILKEVSSSLQRSEDNCGVTASLDRTFYNPPVRLAENMAALIERETALLGFSSMRMNSGAGHDAMVMADFVPTGMIFVPSKDGISHRPDEWTEYASLQKGTEVLLNVVLSLSDATQGKRP